MRARWSTRAKEILYILPTFQHCLILSPLIRWDSTLFWMPARFFIPSLQYRVRKGNWSTSFLQFCYCIAIRLPYLYDVEYMIQFQVSALWSFSLHAFFYMLCTHTHTTSHQYCSLIWTWHRHFIPAASFIKFTALADTQQRDRARHSAILFIHCKWTCNYAKWSTIRFGRISWRTTF